MLAEVGCPLLKWFSLAEGLSNTKLPGCSGLDLCRGNTGIYHFLTLSHLLSVSEIGFWLVNDGN